MSIGNVLALITASYSRLLVPRTGALTVIHHRRALLAESHWLSFSAAIAMRTPNSYEGSRQTTSFREAPRRRASVARQQPPVTAAVRSRPPASPAGPGFPSWSARD